MHDVLIERTNVVKSIVFRVARRARRAHDFFVRLADGGVALSIGQRRDLLVDRLLLDEAEGDVARDDSLVEEEFLAAHALPSGASLITRRAILGAESKESTGVHLPRAPREAISISLARLSDVRVRPTEDDPPAR